MIHHASVKSVYCSWLSVFVTLYTLITAGYSYSDAPSQNEAQCSLYMRELQGFLSRVNSEYLSLFECTDFIMEW